MCVCFAFFSPLINMFAIINYHKHYWKYLTPTPLFPNPCIALYNMCSVLNNYLIKYRECVIFRLSCFPVEQENHPARFQFCKMHTQLLCREQMLIIDTALSVEKQCVPGINNLLR